MTVAIRDSSMPSSFSLRANSSQSASTPPSAISAIARASSFASMSSALRRLVGPSTIAGRGAATSCAPFISGRCAFHLRAPHSFGKEPPSRTARGVAAPRHRGRSFFNQVARHSAGRPAGGGERHAAGRGSLSSTWGARLIGLPPTVSCRRAAILHRARRPSGICRAVAAVPDPLPSHMLGARRDCAPAR